MNANLRWGFATLAIVAAGVALTWVVAGHYHPVPVQEKARGEEPVKLLVAFSSPLAKYVTQSRPTELARILEESELRTPGGKRIEIERVAMSSQEMVEGVLNGSLKAHILIPSSHVYLELANSEWTLRTGKPLTTEKAVFMRQPYVLAARRPMAEALGWPTKDVAWADVVEVARGGWKAAGHPEWGPLKLLILNPDRSDAGLHSVVSIALGTLGKSKGLTSEDLGRPVLSETLKPIDDAVVWYPSSIDDLLRNEALAVPPRCHMTFLPEHLMVELNDRYARRKLPPGWVAMYPAKGTVVDDITAAVVRREWVTEEQREAAGVALKLLRTPEVQQRIMAMGYRPALPEVALAAPLTEAMGVDPKRPREPIEMPPVEVILDCLSAWDKEWQLRRAEPAGTAPPAGAMLATPVGLKRHSDLPPIVQCVHRAKPSIVAIKPGSSKETRGTGVIVDARGYAVTNSHVVGKDKTVAVRFIESDDRVYKGEVVSVDVNQDLAFVRILDHGSYPVIKFADSSEVEVGETAIAIGNPLGYTGTVTVGVVSALDRQITMPSTAVLTQLIQTDASINPGNSGGPLLDIDGQLIGIVVATRSDAQNIAFAIPANRIRTYVKKSLPD
jgi:S1-C subfamily serine protease